MISQDGRIGRMVIVGVGLIGGSLARALRRPHLRPPFVRHIVGVGRSEESLRRAVQLGVIDAYDTNPVTGCANADMIVLASPVGSMANLMKLIAPVLTEHTVLTDVGSVKGSVLENARRELGEHFTRFVPGHPVAGTEHSGVEASFDSLYDNRKVILTPVGETNISSIALVAKMWELAGAHVVNMEIAEHDRILATTSHLPHVLAFALVDFMAKQRDSQALFDFAAGGFYDFTRIASGDPVMWRDICVANKKELGQRLMQFGADLATIGELIEKDEGQALESIFRNANGARQKVGELRVHPNAAPDSDSFEN